MITRKTTKQIKIGNVAIGGGAPIVVQSMTKTDTRDIEATSTQIKSLALVGCEVVRVAVPDMQAAEALGPIKAASPIPVVADIHFDYKLALEAIKQGVDGLRLNPGNIGSKRKVKAIVDAAKDRNLPIRVGVNAGSLHKDILQKYGHPTPEALVQSAEEQIHILEDMGYEQIKVSLKASNVMLTVEAYRLFSSKFDYPLHIGISEAGPAFSGIIKSSVGLAMLLAEGVGDTIRVSLTDEPELEVRTAYEILRALGIRKRSVEIISCPTCGRCKIDLKPLVSQVESAVKGISKPLSIAVMGCVVNGPGEAKEADFGIAGGKGSGIVFKKGQVIKTVKEKELLPELLRLINEHKDT